MKKKCLSGLWYLSIALCVLSASIFRYDLAWAQPAADAASPVSDAVIKLVGFCQNPQGGFDEKAAYVLIDYVLKNKPKKELALPGIQEATGAYYEFDTKVNFANFLKYSFNHQIPASLTSPSSLRYSIWNGQPGPSQRMPANWRKISPADEPFILRGIQRDAITPDLTTGVYYEYDLQKTLILLNYKGRQALVTISKQVDKSNVGKKGVILGSDDDWNYYYSDEPGSARSGLGWVKSYIYDFFSVAVYVETTPGDNGVRSGFFQWIRAGWSGVNFVQAEHVIKGMKRYARNFNAIMESPQLPPAEKIVATYQRLAALPGAELRQQYTALREAQKALAVESGKIKRPAEAGKDLASSVSKEQIMEELMLEYFKISMGKNSLLSAKQFLALISH
ncbi:MAG TPA: hypothetical protein P5183_06600 [Smithellaceae bacterium]|nr:hypothetical protein [Smithellaceae bacterium]